MLRLISLCVAVLFAGQGVLPALHYVLSPHRVCPEHGELVEGHAQAAPTKGADFVASALRAGDDERHEHDHCSSWVRSRSEGLSPLAATIRLSQTIAPQPSTASTARTLPSGLARYRIAPKQSPPFVVS